MLFPRTIKAGEMYLRVTHEAAKWRFAYQEFSAFLEFSYFFEGKRSRLVSASLPVCQGMFR